METTWIDECVETAKREIIDLLSRGTEKSMAIDKVRREWKKDFLIWFERTEELIENYLEVKDGLNDCR